MKERLYIDDVDAFAQYGVFVRDGGYNGVVVFPSLKKVESNSWAEDDGIDVDLLTPELDSKEFKIEFGSINSEKTVDFLNMLSDGAYHDFDFAEIGVTRRLRLVSQPSRSTLLTLETFSLQVADDFPLEDYVREDPVPIASVWQRGHFINGIDISEYGIWLLKGTYDDMERASEVKKNLFVNGDNMQGAIYDGANVVFQEKETSLRCFIRARTTDIFWRNYNAFLFDMTRPGERQMYSQATDQYFSFYYKSAQISTFSVLDGKDVWCEFNVAVVFTSFRPGQIEYLLSSEDDRMIVTEDSTENYVEFINLKEYEDR